MPVLTYALAFLMVSGVRYTSTKEMNFLRTRHFEAIVAAILLLVIVLIQPAIMLFLIAMGYMISGPARYLFRRKAVSEATERPVQHTPHVPHSRDT